MKKELKKYLLLLVLAFGVLASSKAQLTACAYSTCVPAIPFRTVDRLQIYGALVSAINSGTGTSSACGYTTCVPQISFRETDNLQIYGAILSLSNAISGGSNDWKLIGNSVSTNSNVFGTTTNRSVLFYTNNTQVGKLDSAGHMTLGPTNPGATIFRISATGSGGGTQTGIFLQPTINSQATTAFRGVLIQPSFTTTAFTMGAYQGLIIGTPGTSASNTITAATMLDIQDFPAQALSGDGILLRTNAGTNRYGIRQSGTAQNSLMGPLVIGTVVPTASLHVVGTGSISGTFTVGRSSSGVIVDNTLSSGNITQVNVVNSDNPQVKLSNSLGNGLIEMSSNDLYLTAQDAIFLRPGNGANQFTVNTEGMGAAGSVSMTTAGSRLSVRGGANAAVGTVTLAAGTVTVSNTGITANSLIFLQGENVGAAATWGELSVTRNAGSGFVITSSNVADVRSVYYFIVEQL